MPENQPAESHLETSELNWLGKTVYAGGTIFRLTANVVEATARRVGQIAAESKKAYERELDPNIEDARVIEERPSSGQGNAS